MATEATYTVLARRYRPTRFEEVVGQEHVATTLRNAIGEKRVGHAYLFTGPRGVGKTTMARLLAKALNCVRGPSDSPCNACEICRSVQEGADTDVIEMDAASNRSVEDARDLRDGIRYSPLRARSKIYIIDEAHMLTREAFNTLLKTLEEPPPHVKFIFATTEAHKLPETITSRCQRFDFRRITTGDIVRRLEQVMKGEGLQVAPGVLASIARAARGSMRDAESLLDQLVAYKAKDLAPDDVASVLGEAGGERLSELLGALASGEAGRVFTSLGGIFASGVDSGAFTDQLLERFRTLLALKACGRKSEVVDLPDGDLAECEKQAEGFTLEALLYFIQLVFEAKRRIKDGSHARFVLEMYLVKMARSSDLLTLAEAARLAPAQGAAGFLTPKVAPAGAPPGNPALAESGAPAPPEESAPEAPSLPEPGPPAPPPFTGTPADLVEAQASWPRVITAVKEKSRLAGTLLGEGRLTRFAGDEISFSLPSRFSKFHVSQLDNPKNRVAIDAALQSVFGKKMTLRVSLESGGTEAAPARKPLPQGDATSDAGVKKILETFGGSRVVGIE
jgi:DNA polymerase-3 subunit gamma/tau